MGCAVQPPSEPGGVEQVTFLYRLTDGACPKSYGASCARLAGLPDAVVRRAAEKAAESEVARTGGQSGDEGQGMEVDGGSGGGGAQAVQLLTRVRAACRAAAGGDAGAAADVVRLQAEVKALLAL